VQGLKPEDLALWSAGRWRGGVPRAISGIANDTRKLETGNLFAAFRTERRDGHDFLEAAAMAGAAGAVVERYLPEISMPQLVVKDVGSALLAMARGYRLGWPGDVIGITGSCGKTTCKEILRCLFSFSRSLATEGNRNNLIGVPISLLRPEGSQSEYAIIEAGISEPGEMRRLAGAIDPDWAIVTSIGAAHLKELGAVSNVAREKGELARGERVHATFLGASCEPFVGELGARNARLVKPDASLSADFSFRFECGSGRTRFEQRHDDEIFACDYEGVGDGLASNMALALALAGSMGLDLARLRSGLSDWRPSALRNEWRWFGGRAVYLDCYNANPVSMAEALRTFSRNAPASQPRLYLVGCMEELGEGSSKYHYELGRSLPLRAQDQALVIGEDAPSVLAGTMAEGRSAKQCCQIWDAAQALEVASVFEGSLFLKGSRRYKLETVIESLFSSDPGGTLAC